MTEEKSCLLHIMQRETPQIFRIFHISHTFSFLFSLAGSGKEGRRNKTEANRLSINFCFSGCVTRDGVLEMVCCRTEKCPSPWEEKKQDRKKTNPGVQDEWKDLGRTERGS